MSFWMVFWKFFFIVVLILFAGMAIWVAIGGFLDIKKLFRRLEEEHKQSDSKDP